MSTMTRRHVLAAMACACAAAAWGQTARPGALPRFRRGINIHHVLNWPVVNSANGRAAYAWPPFQEPRYALRDADLQRLNSLGFDFLRLTVEPGLCIAANDAQWADLQTHFLGVARQVLQAGFNLVFDLHPVRAHPDFAPESLVAGIGAPQFEAYARMAARVARMLTALPAERVALELMNEPAIASLVGTNKWQAMLERLHEAARAAAPQLALILTGVAWCDRRGLMRLNLAPFQSSNVLYTFHYYDPSAFTHQGVSGHHAQWLCGLNWPVTPAAVDEAMLCVNRAAGGNAAALGQARQALNAALTQRPDAATIRNDFQELARWAAAQGVPPERILLGEFGCVYSAHGVELGPSRLDWLRAVRVSAEACGFPWAYWAFQGKGGMEFVDEAGRWREELFAPLGLV